MFLKKFQRKKEDFKCKNCGALMYGNGYTNHCGICLYSMHVDVYPGDRLSSCGGMMKPVDVYVSGGKYTILHQCERCGFERKNKVNKKDNFDAVLKILTKK